MLVPPAELGRANTAGVAVSSDSPTSPQAKGVTKFDHATKSLAVFPVTLSYPMLNDLIAPGSQDLFILTSHLVLGFSVKCGNPD